MHKNLFSEVICTFKSYIILGTQICTILYVSLKKERNYHSIMQHGFLASNNFYFYIIALWPIISLLRDFHSNLKEFLCSKIRRFLGNESKIRPFEGNNNSILILFSFRDSRTRLFG